MNVVHAALIERCTRLLAAVSFQNYSFTVRESHGGVFLQASYMEPDIYTKEPALQHTRKWLLSPAMSDSEIVSTVFKCCLTSMEHRCREDFTYKGARIFGPHFNVDDLARICLDGKENAGAREYVGDRSE